MPAADMAAAELASAGVLVGVGDVAGDEAGEADGDGDSDGDDVVGVMHIALELEVE